MQAEDRNATVQAGCPHPTFHFCFLLSQLLIFILGAVVI
jgi:hypothetical protein